GSEDVAGAAGERVLDGYRTREVNESSRPGGWSEDVPGAAGERVLDGYRTRELNESSHPGGWSEDVPEAAGERVLHEHQMREVNESSQLRGWSEDSPEWTESRHLRERVVPGRDRPRRREPSSWVAHRSPGSASTHGRSMLTTSHVLPLRHRLHSS